MNKADREIIENAKGYLISHKLDLLLMGIGATIGAVIGYYWWVIDFI